MYPWSPLVSESRLPVLGREGSEVVLVRHPGQPGEDVLQVRQGVFPVSFAGDDERVQDRRALPGVRVADKEPVFLAYAGRADRIFDEVIIEAGFAVVQVADEGLRSMSSSACRLGQALAEKGRETEVRVKVRCRLERLPRPRRQPSSPAPCYPIDLSDRGNA